LTRQEWTNVITRCCEQAGTYKAFFDPVIDTLAGILEQRDEAEADFDAEGRRLMVEHTNKAGATNIEQNPLRRMINDLNRDALAYWRDLGLTPAGLKRVNEQALRRAKRSPLAEAMKGLGG